MGLFDTPVLTPGRVRFAYAIALATDLLQVALGPVGWMFADEALDVAAMMLIWRAIGFNPLLLPTFALECLPVADLLPTWTGCVALVVAVRRKHRVAPADAAAEGRVIDVRAEPR